MSTLADLPLFGSTYSPERDLERLTAQRQRVARAMVVLGWCDAGKVERQMHRMFGKHEKVESVARQMRYVREWAHASDGWTWMERDAGGGSKLYCLVRAA